MRSYKRHPQTAGRVIDGLAFVITADDNKLHTLNETGTVLWNLAGGGLTVASGAAELSLHFEVEYAAAQADVAECIQQLVERSILVEFDLDQP